MNITTRKARYLLSVGAAAVATVAVGAVVLAADNPYDDRQSDESLPPPAHSIWISPDGEFEVWEYDDRELSDEEKERNPVINPRWEPFAECMADRGRTVVDGAPSDMRQSDLDALVTRLNEEYPDRDANKEVGGAADTSGLAADFLSCADEWLNLDQAELEERLP